MLYRYKPDEGRNARQTAFWLGTAFLAYGCWSLRSFLQRFSGLRRHLVESMPELPLFGSTLNASLVIAVAVFVVAMTFWVRFLAAPRPADHLIEVESEMHKVTWPSFKEATNSSIIVIGTVIVLSTFLAFADFVLGKVFQAILWQV